MKLLLLVAIILPTFTSIGADTVYNVVGNATLNWVVVAELTVTLLPPNVTTLYAAMGLKFVPLTNIGEPPGADAGLNPEIAGGCTLNDAVLFPIRDVPAMAMEICPVGANCGTVTISCVELPEITAAEYPPLKETILFEGVGSKLLPLTVTASPGGPLVGEKLVMTGFGNTVKFAPLPT
jgi:hypothetical protein